MVWRLLCFLFCHCWGPFGACIWVWSLRFFESVCGPFGVNSDYGDFVNQFTGLNRGPFGEVGAWAGWFTKGLKSSSACSWAESL